MKEEKYLINQLLHHVVVTSDDDNYTLVTHRVFFDKKNSDNFFIKCMERGDRCFWYTSKLVQGLNYENAKKYVELELNFDYD